ncbi:MAG: lipopolysaccharide heptosyltransferase II [Omnitrophica bacterium RIFCSPLOWO2_01_FULL_45_24]|nr:MAG: lipopolysaccharide heptosyltransferase II [Omnitrophica bacterium RIFCSPLOWO2_01_FULL_45_24]
MDKGQKDRVRGQKYKKILIVRMDKIGDLVLSTPAIKAVRDTYPDSYIAVLVRPYAREIIEGNPYINEVITYDKTNGDKGLLKNIRFILNLRKKKFDLALVLHPKNRTHIFLFLAGIPARIGYDKKLGVLLTKKIPHIKQYGLKHEIDYTLDLLRYIGVEPKEKALYVPVNKASEKKIGGIFAENGISEDDMVITIHPGSSCPSKRWRAEHFAKVADSLAQNYKAKIVIIAGPGDKDFGDKTAELMKSKKTNLSCKTTIADLASILKRTRLFISNDSGPVHIACAVGAPTIAIFGRNDRGLSPTRWRPVGEHDIALHKDIGCETCLSHNCALGFACLEAITEEEVLQAAEKILGRPV